MPSTSPDTGLHRLTRTRRQTAWWLLRSPMTAAVSAFLLAVATAALVLWPPAPATGGCVRGPAATRVVTAQPVVPPTGPTATRTGKTESDTAAERVDDPPPTLTLRSPSGAPDPTGCDVGLGGGSSDAPTGTAPTGAVHP